jgi:hypothetical protein
MSSTAGRKLKYLIYSAYAVCGCILLAASAIAVEGSNDANLNDPTPPVPQTSSNSAAINQSEINELKRQLADQQKQIGELRATLQELTKHGGNGAATSVNNVQPSMSSGSRISGEAASTTPMFPSINAATSPVLSREEKKKEEESAPLQFRLGSAYFTPVGFMDFTAVFRDTNPGSNIGTNFGSIPYRTASNVTGNLSEFRLSPQNSRLGMRVDAIVGGAKVMGYWESDFLGGTGNPPVGNISVSSNSYPFRLRLYWVDVRKDKFEFLGGQTWSLLTPGRKGISPIPGDLFYTNVVDVNYQLGLVWGRIPEFRIIYHPSDKVTIAVALGNAEQYIGGSGGAGTIVLPISLATAYAGQLNNGTTTLAVPNMHPDIIAKIAFDPVKRLHFEVGAVERTFKTYNPLTARHFTTAGGGIQANLNIEFLKNFRFVTNNYWSDGGGRYIFGQAPDLVVRNDGSASLIHSGSTVSGFEFTHKSFQAYTYYGGVYIARNVIVAPNNGNLIGYGFAGSANSQNRSVQECTVGFINTFWKDGKVGALSLMGQYSYFVRNPWYVASGMPKNTHMNEVWLNLRYTLPGSAPSLK